MNHPKEKPATAAQPKDLVRLRDELTALTELMLGGDHCEPAGTARETRAQHRDSLSDEDAVEAQFDNLPV
jgi:hypothetical protein